MLKIQNLKKSYGKRDSKRRKNAETPRTFTRADNRAGAPGQVFFR